MDMRTVGSHPRFLLVLALCFVACAEENGPVAPAAPSADGAFDPAGPETTTPVPGPIPFDQMLQVTSAEGCALPGGPYARFVRRMAPPTAGMHLLTSDAGLEPCNDAPEDAGNHFTWSQEGEFFTWTATVPVGAVILQSGSAARVYTYGQRSWGDAGLRGPNDPMTGAPLEVDAVVVCHDYALLVDVDLQARLVTRTDWSMQGQATGQSWDLFPGDLATARVTLQLSASAPVNEPATAVGRVTITNDTPLPARLTSVTNHFSGGFLIPIDFQATLPLDLQPGESLVGTYSQPFPNQQTRTNTVTANTTGDVRGGTARATLEFGARVPETATATVISSDGRTFGPFSASTALTIEREFEAVATDPAMLQIPWTFEFHEDQGSFATSVTVRRHDPQLALTATPRFTRRWSWYLEHGFETGASSIEARSLASVQAWVRAGTDGSVDSDFGTSGHFVLANPHPSRPFEVDVLTVGVGTHLEAPLGSNWSVGPAEERSGDFDLALTDGNHSASSAMVRYVTRSFAADGRSVVRGVAEISRQVALAFDQPTSQVDASAWLGDTIVGDLGEVQVATSPSVVEYLVPLDGAAPCGVSSIEGQARLRTVDSAAHTSVTYVIEVDIDCGVSDACTRGRGYWRNHADDPAWSAAGPASTVFASELSWMDALARPVHGDPYVQLASAWVAARLNRLAGADVAVIAQELAQAEALLAAHRPGGVSKAAAEPWRALAATLEDFNEGRIGPGTCVD